VNDDDLPSCPLFDAVMEIDACVTPIHLHRATC